MLKAIPQRELIDEDGPEGEPASIAQARGRHLAMTIEDALKLFVEVLDRQRAQLVKEAAHLHPVVGVGVSAHGEA